MMRRTRRRFRGGTRKVFTNPFTSEFHRSRRIINALDPNNLAVAVIENSNLPEINANITLPTTSGITPEPLAHLTMLQRFVIGETALMVTNRYAPIDVFGINTETELERRSKFMAGVGKSSQPMMELPAPAEVFRMCHDNLLNDELVDAVARRLAGPAGDKDYDLSLILSPNLLKVAAQLRVEGILKMALVGDLHVSKEEDPARMKAANALIKKEGEAAEEARRQKIIAELLAEEKAEEAAKMKKSGKKIAATAAESSAAQSSATESSATESSASKSSLLNSERSINEIRCIISYKYYPILKAENYIKIGKALGHYADLVRQRSLLKLHRTILTNAGILRSEILALKANADRSMQNRRKVERLDNRLDNLMHIEGAISYQKGFLLSRRECNLAFNPIANCAEGRAMDEKDEAEAQQYEKFYQEGMKLMAMQHAKNYENRTQLATKLGKTANNIETRYYRTPAGKIIHMFVTRDTPRKGTELILESNEQQAHRYAREKMHE